MRKMIIILIALLSVAILGLCVLLGLGLSGRFPSGSIDWRMGGSYRLVQEKEFPAAEIESILVEYARSGNDVTVYPAEGDSVIVREYANYEAAENELAQIRQQGGKLTVKGPGRNRFFFFSFSFNSHSYTEVYLPAGYSGSLDIETVSGNISIEGDLLLEGELVLASTSGDIDADSRTIQAADCRVTSVSGDIRLFRLETDRADISTTSGEIRLAALKSGEADLGSISGDIRLDEAAASLTCSTTSGEIRIRSGAGKRKASSISGDVFLGLTELSGEMSVDTTSGDIRLELPAEFSAEFEADTTSGDIETFFDEILRYSKKGNHAQGTVGGGAYRIKLGTVSGDVKMERGK